MRINFTSLLTWLRQPTHLVLVLVILISSWLRLWNIDGTLLFLGDQGRDAMIVADIFTKGDLVFIGPVTSVGNMYLGPLYYYFMVPFLWLSYPSPLGPAYAVAVLGIFTTFLMYLMGKDLVPRRAALIAASLFGLSATAVQFSRFSWNPNPAPLASLILIWSSYKALTKTPKYWLLAAGAFSVLIQLHYLTLLSAAGAGLIWLWQLKGILVRPKASSKKKTTSLRDFLLITAGAAAIFIISLTPLVLFDIKHGFLNAKAFTQIFTQEEAFNEGSQTFAQKSWRSIKETHGRSLQIMFESVVGTERLSNTLLLVALIVTTGTFLWQKYRRQENMTGITVILTYLLTGIAGTAIYEHTIFVHYILYLFPVVFLLLGWVLDLLLQNKFTVIFAVAYLALFGWYNINNYPLRDLGWTIDDIQRTSQTIYDRVEPGEKYNIVLLTGTGDIDGQNYRYYLEATDRPPVELEARGEVETLFIINEDRKLERVVDSPVYEIVVFPDKEPTEVYTVQDGPEITVLKSNQAGELSE